MDKPYLPTEEDVKDYLALYDDVLSYQELSELCECSIEYLNNLYNEMFDDGTLLKRKQKMQNKLMVIGIYRINPLTFEVKKYHSSKSLQDDGYSTSNVFTACRKHSSICKGYLWRYGIEIPKGADIERLITEQLPEYYKVIFREDMETCEIEVFNSVFATTLAGYRIRDVMTAIINNTKYCNSYWGYIDGR